MNQLLDGIRIALCLSFLLYASWSDYKTREVSNRVWVIFAPIAFGLTALQFLLYAPELLFPLGLSFGLMAILAFAIFYAGAFGGADAKALMCLALALPVYPTYLLHQPFGSVSPLFPLTVFINAVLLAALSVFYALFRNFFWRSRTKRALFEGLEHETIGRKILTLICGYKVRVSKLRETEFLYPLEDISADEMEANSRNLLVLPKDEAREEIVTRVVEAANTGRIDTDVWVTPGLPMLIFITAGLVIALIYGDIVWTLLRSILG